MVITIEKKAAPKSVHRKNPGCRCALLRDYFVVLVTVILAIQVF